jgi:hypothetical protein
MKSSISINRSKTNTAVNQENVVRQPEIEACYVGFGNELCRIDHIYF